MFLKGEIGQIWCDMPLMLIPYFPWINREIKFERPYIFTLGNTKAKYIIPFELY